MKKLITAILIIISAAQAGLCSLQTDEINIFNLKKNNMYIINFGTKINNISISDKKILDITPVTSLINDKEQLFIDAKENGVCDVIINTEKEEYRIRFITGPAFQENKESLTEIDIPVAYNKETK